MSFKRFDTEDVVLSSELVTFPTWYTQNQGDTDTILEEEIVSGPEQGPSVDYYIDYYSAYSGSSGAGATASSEDQPHYDADHSKPLFSLTFAQRPEGDGIAVPDAEGNVKNSYIIYGQYRSLVLGDEYSDFTFGSTDIGSSTDDEEEIKRRADSFMAMTVDRSRFREKLDPITCEFHFKVGETDNSDEIIVLKPDTSANRRYLDAGRVFDLAQLVSTENPETGEVTSSLVYPTSSVTGERTSYGYFLPDIGVVLFNTSDSGSLFGGFSTSYQDLEEDDLGPKQFIDDFKKIMKVIKVRSQETVTSNFVFVRARNGEFNYSTNPSNIVGSAGNIRHDVMINQPQSFITTVGLYNDSNELLAVAKLSRPLVKDFTKEALIRIKLDY